MLSCSLYLSVCLSVFLYLSILVHYFLWAMLPEINLIWFDSILSVHSVVIVAGRDVWNFCLEPNRTASSMPSPCTTPDEPTTTSTQIFNKFCYCTIICVRTLLRKSEKNTHRCSVVQCPNFLAVWLDLAFYTFSSFVTAQIHCLQLRHCPLLQCPCHFLSFVNVHSCNFSQPFPVAPSVLWRCWLGGRKGIGPVKNWVMVCCRLSWLMSAFERTLK